MTTGEWLAKWAIIGAVVSILATWLLVYVVYVFLGTDAAVVSGLVIYVVWHTLADRVFHGGSGS